LTAIPNSLPAAVHQLEMHREQRQLQAVRRAGLVQDIRQVVFDGCLAEGAPFNTLRRGESYNDLES
jgi:hypothetical protein